MRRIYVWRDGQLVDKATGLVDPRGSNLPPQAPLIQIDAYSRDNVRSPVDGSLLHSRQSVREHNKRNDVVDIGNDRNSETEKPLDFQKDLMKDMKTSYQMLQQNSDFAKKALHAEKQRTIDRENTRMLS